MEYSNQQILSKPRRKRRGRVFAVWFALAAVLQLAGLAYANWMLTSESDGPTVNDQHLTEVVDRDLRLADNLQNPELMAISPDKTLLALRDNGQLKIFSLADGALVHEKSFDNEDLITLQWLPDRNRLIYGVVRKVSEEETIIEEPPAWEQPEDPHSKEPLTGYRTKTVVKNGYKLSLYSYDAASRTGNAAELIKTLAQNGGMPNRVDLLFSTYSNLLYVRCSGAKAEHYLGVVDIMKRVKDLRLPPGDLTNLAVAPQTGDLWAESETQNGYNIYNYRQGHWKLAKDLDGYRLLGISADDRLALALDQQDWVSEVALRDKNGNLTPAWAFNTPVKASQLHILPNGSLLRIDPENSKTSVYPTGNQGTTVYQTASTGAVATDGKMLAAWNSASGSLRIYQEVTK